MICDCRSTQARGPWSNASRAHCATSRRSLIRVYKAYVKYGSLHQHPLRPGYPTSPLAAPYSLSFPNDAGRFPRQCLYLGGPHCPHLIVRLRLHLRQTIPTRVSSNKSRLHHDIQDEASLLASSRLAATNCGADSRTRLRARRIARQHFISQGESDRPNGTLPAQDVSIRRVRIRHGIIYAGPDGLAIRSLSRKFVGSDGREYTWNRGCVQGQEWTVRFSYLMVADWHTDC